MPRSRSYRYAERCRRWRDTQRGAVMELLAQQRPAGSGANQDDSDAPPDGTQWGVCFRTVRDWRRWVASVERTWPGLVAALLVSFPAGSAGPIVFFQRTDRPEWLPAGRIDALRALAGRCRPDDSAPGSP